MAAQFLSSKGRFQYCKLTGQSLKMYRNCLDCPHMHQYYAKQHSEIATPCGMNPVSTTYLTYGLKARKHRTNSYKHLMNPNVVVVVPKVLRNVVEISVLHCEQFKLFSLYFYITVSLLYVVICFTLCLKRNVCYFVVCHHWNPKL